MSLTTLPTTRPSLSIRAELSAEEVASRLGIPVAMLIRRIEDGTVPARPVANGGGTHYLLRLADLGTTASGVAEAGVDEPLATTEDGAEGAVAAEPVASAPAVADSDDGPTAGDQLATETGGAESDGEQPAVAAPAAEHHAVPQASDANGTAEHGADEAPAAAGVARHGSGGDRGDDPDGGRAAADGPAIEPVAADALSARVKLRTAEVAGVAAEPETVPAPVAELGMMGIDPRELVVGLLDRWERTLEQRIYAEQRQRFEGELSHRQSQVKHLQLEIQAARAEHAALLADRDRAIVERDRRITELQAQMEAKEQALARPRGWFFRR